MLSDIANIHEGNRHRIKDREKALIFHSVFSGTASTRKSLAEKLTIRPTTISRVVYELLEDRILIEGERKNVGRKGRPENILLPNLNRFVAIAIYVVSREMKGVMINLGEEILSERAFYLDEHSDNDKIFQSIKTITDYLAPCKPEGSELLGVGVSLPGTVNTREMRWISAARWPSLSNLSLAKLPLFTGTEVSLHRGLDAELEYLLLKRGGYRQGGILLFHWGFGIGSAYAHNGTVLKSNIGRFGEIGHCRVNYAENPALQLKKCSCGSYGCLETEAALWAILPQIRSFYPDAPEEEVEFARYINSAQSIKRSIETIPLLHRALSFVILGLANINQIFFPDKIILYGPFFQNKGLFDFFLRSFLKAVPSYSRNTLEVELLNEPIHGEIFGSTHAFFKKALKELLIARWE